MAVGIDPSAMAEAIERARFDQLRQGTWSDLRAGERATRVKILQDAIASSGVAAEIDELRDQAGRTAQLLEMVARRDREAAASLAAHDAEIVRLADRVTALRAEVSELTAALAAAETRADAAERVVETVRGAVAPVDRHPDSRHRA